MHVLHTVLYTFPNALARRICLPIKSFLPWWPFPLFLYVWFRSDIIGRNYMLVTLIRFLSCSLLVKLVSICLNAVFLFALRFLVLTQFWVTLPGWYTGIGSLTSNERSMGTRKRHTLLGKSWDWPLSNGMRWSRCRKTFSFQGSYGLTQTFGWVYYFMGNVFSDRVCRMWASLVVNPLTPRSD